MEDKSKYLNPNKNRSVLNVNFMGQKKRINSPKSIQALHNLGFDEEDLFYVSFNEYKLMNPEIISLHKEMQMSRYDFYEKRRQEKVEMVMKERNEMNNLEECGENLNMKIDSESNYKSKFSLMGNSSSTALNEIKSLERIKKRQDTELLGLLQYELKREFIRQDNEQKLRIKREKEEKISLEKLNKTKNEEEKRKDKEKEKELKIKIEEDENRKKEYQKLIEEHLREKEIQEKEKLILKEQKKKFEEEKKKQEEFKKLMEDKYKEKQETIMKNQEKLAIKEEERKQIIAKKIMERIQSSKEKSQYKQRKIEILMKNRDELLKSKRDEFEKKQEKNELKRFQYEQLRELAFKDKKEASIKKNNQIQRILDNKKLLENKKIEEYYLKQSIAQKRKEEIDEFQKELKMNEKRLKSEKDKKIQITLKNNELIESTKKSKVLEKIEKNQDKVLYVNMMKERELMEKNEKQFYINFEKKENLKRISKYKEVNSLRIMQKLEEKNRKCEDFKTQKLKIYDKKKQIQSEISQKRIMFFDKFDKIFQKRTIDDKEIKALQSIFPSNPDIIKTFKVIRNNSYVKPFKTLSTSLEKTRKKPYKIFKLNQTTNKMNNQSKIGSRLATPVKTNYDFKFKEKETFSHRPLSNTLIERSTYNTTQGGTVQSNVNTGNHGVAKGNLMYNTLGFINNSYYLKSEQYKNLYEDYKFKLNQELLELLSLERESEIKRERVLMNCKTNEERAKFQKIFAMERKQATQKIVNLNEEIEKKLIEYERKLSLST